MKTLYLILSFLFIGSNFSYAQKSDFYSFSVKVDNENSLKQLDILREEEQQKFNETKNKYHLYNIRYIEARICSLGKDNNCRLKKLLWITEDCPDCTTEQIAWVNYHVAATLSSLNSNLSIEYAEKSLSIARKKKYAGVYPLAASLSATIYYNNKNFIDGKKYFIEAKRNANPKDTVFNASMFNNIALCYMNMNQNKEAHIYFLKALNKMKTIRNTNEGTEHFQIVVEGNIGTILDRLGNYEKAIILLEKEIAYYLKNEHYNECTNPLMELLDLYQRMGRSEKEVQIIKQIQFIEKLDNNAQKAPLLTEKLYSYYLKKNMNEKALIYSEKLIQLLKKYSERINKQSDELNQILYYEKIAHLKSERSTQQKLLNHANRGKKQSQTISFTLIILVLLLFTLGWLIIRDKTKRARKDVVIFEQAKQIEINKNIILENEIQQQQDKITNMAMNLNLKKETEKAFLAKIKEIKKRKNIDLELVIKELQMSVTNLLQIDEKMLHSNIETDVVNQKFKAILASKHPQLSKSDLNFCCYFRLNLSSKEIGALHQMSDISVRVLKNKIKNKIELNQEESLNRYLTNLNV